jgi:hypothetical protein
MGFLQFFRLSYSLGISKILPLGVLWEFLWKLMPSGGLLKQKLRFICSYLLDQLFMYAFICYAELLTTLCERWKGWGQPDVGSSSIIQCLSMNNVYIIEWPVKEHSFFFCKILLMNIVFFLPNIIDEFSKLMMNYIKE